MKNKILLPLAIVLVVLFAPHSIAQTKLIQLTATNSSETLPELTAFTGKHLKGTTYLHWEVCNQDLDGYYAVYRSYDGENFTLLGGKQGIGVKLPIEIAFYFQDENPEQETSYYKLAYITKDKTFYPSAIVTVIKPVSEFSSASNDRNMSETQIAVPFY